MKFSQKGVVNMPFTVEELTFIDIYRTSDIEATKKEIRKAIPIIDDANMIALAENVLSKLDKVSSNEFEQLDFANVLSMENVGM